MIQYKTPAKMDDPDLTAENLSKLCRLCLQPNEYIFDIFQHNEDDKECLSDHIFELYQVKVVLRDNILPKKICHRCLYLTESYTEFRNKVRKCEAKLQTLIAKIGIAGSTIINNDDDDVQCDWPYENAQNSDSTTKNTNGFVTVIDPDQEYGSEDSFDISDDDDEEEDEDDEYDVTITPTTELLNGSNEDLEGSHVENHTNIPNLNGMMDTNDIGNENLNYSHSENHEAPEGVKNVFLCQYCDMAFTSQLECAEHEARHDAANPHSCNYCPFRCANRQTIISHIRDLHDGERPYVCVQCNKGFGRRSDLKKHTIVHTGIRPFTCPVCGKNFSRNTNLTKHLRIHTGLKPHVCQKCPRSFTTTADLIRHERVHNNFKQFKCQKCPSAFTRKDKLLHHERNHLRKEQDNQGLSNDLTGLDSGLRVPDNFDAENMVIALDPFHSLNQSDQVNNMRADTSILAPLHQRGVSDHPQDIQQLQFQQKQHLEMQQQQHYHQMQAHYHQQQQQIQQQLQALHNQQQQEQKPGNVSLNSSRLGQGSDKDRIFSCDICPKKFLQESSLAAHRSKHSAERNHVCPICGKAFMRKRELQRHSVIHTGAKPFACSVCHKRFNRKDKVARHEKIHAEDKHPCTFCNMIFLTKEKLEAHLKLHNNVNKLPPLIPKPNHLDMNNHPSNHMPTEQYDFKPKMNFYSEIKTEPEAE